jgi:NADPH:quinone reductase-like Zn-dependent oxidoreductase
MKSPGRKIIPSAEQLRPLIDLWQAFHQGKAIPDIAMPGQSLRIGRQMKALVTGGTGLVGRYIVETLLDAGYDLVVAGRTTPAESLFPWNR